MEKLIGDGKTTIDSVDIGLPYKVFVIGMLHTFFYTFEAD